MAGGAADIGVAAHEGAVAAEIESDAAMRGGDIALAPRVVNVGELDMHRPDQVGMSVPLISSLGRRGDAGGFFDAAPADRAPVLVDRVDRGLQGSAEPSAADPEVLRRDQVRRGDVRDAERRGDTRGAVEAH